MAETKVFALFAAAEGVSALAEAEARGRNPLMLDWERGRGASGGVEADNRACEFGRGAGGCDGMGGDQSCPICDFAPPGRETGGRRPPCPMSDLARPLVDLPRLAWV